MLRIFGHYVPRPLFVLGVVETSILLFAIVLSVFLRVHDTAGALPPVASILSKAAVFAVVMLLVMTALGLYQNGPREGEWGYFPRVLVSFFVGLLVMAALIHMSPSLSLGSGALVPAFLLALAGVSVSRVYYRRLAADTSV